MYNLFLLMSVHWFARIKVCNCNPLSHLSFVQILLSAFECPHCGERWVALSPRLPLKLCVLDVMWLLAPIDLPWKESNIWFLGLYLSIRNNEVQFAGEIQPRGCCYTLQIPSGNQKVELFGLIHYMLLNVASPNRLY